MRVCATRWLSCASGSSRSPSTSKSTVAPFFYFSFSFHFFLSADIVSSSSSPCRKQSKTNPTFFEALESWKFPKKDFEKYLHPFTSFYFSSSSSSPVSLYFRRY
jgi:hypothetical protein